MKFQCGVTIVIVEWVPGHREFRVIYREEVEKSEYGLTVGVNRVIALNEAYRPDHIYVDRGYNEMGVETLKNYGQQHRSSRLHEIVKGISFSQNEEIIDPIDGTSIKKQFKSLMVNNMMKLFEDHEIKFSKYDTKFRDQLANYQIIGGKGDRITTTRKNEHIIDAVGLAVYALYSTYRDNIKFKPASVSFTMPTPKHVPSKVSVEKDNNLFGHMKTAFVSPRTYLGLGRGNLSNKPPTRSKI